jgi:hypothetical protein
LIWEQLAVSAAGILIMVGISWFRAAKVPDLFVRVTESNQPALDAGEPMIQGPQGCRGVAAPPDRCAAPERPQVELAFGVKIRYSPEEI